MVIVLGKQGYFIILISFQIIFSLIYYEYYFYYFLMISFWTDKLLITPSAVASSG